MRTWGSKLLDLMGVGALVVLVWLAAMGPAVRFWVIVLCAAAVFAARAGSLLLSGRLRREWTGLLILVPLLVGVLVCCELTARSVYRRSVSPTLDAICKAGPANLCDQALQSRWARIGPFSTAVMGLAYFELLVGWFVLAGTPRRAGRGWHGVPTAVAGLGVCISGWLVWVLLTKLPAVCPQCLIAHGANGMAAVIILLMWLQTRAGRREQSLSETMSWPARLAAIGFLAALVLPQPFVPLVMYRVHESAAWKSAYQKLAGNAAFMQFRYGRSAYHEIPIRGDDPAWGPPDAPHRLVVFLDVACDPCADFEDFFREYVKDAYKDRIRLVVKHYPQSTQCNPYAKQDLHPFSCQASYACEAARIVGGNRGFFMMHDRLVQNRRRLAERPYEKVANAIGLDGKRVVAEMQSEAVRRRVAEDIDLANRLGVNGTPRIFLDGRLVEGWRNLDLWRALLEAKPPARK